MSLAVGLLLSLALGLLLSLAVGLLLSLAVGLLLSLSVGLLLSLAVGLLLGCAVRLGLAGCSRVSLIFAALSFLLFLPAFLCRSLLLLTLVIRFFFLPASFRFLSLPLPCRICVARCCAAACLNLTVLCAQLGIELSFETCSLLFHLFVLLLELFLKRLDLLDLFEQGHLGLLDVLALFALAAFELALVARSLLAHGLVLLLHFLFERLDLFDLFEQGLFGLGHVLLSLFDLVFDRVVGLRELRSQQRDLFFQVSSVLGLALTLTWPALAAIPCPSPPLGAVCFDLVLELAHVLALLAGKPVLVLKLSNVDPALVLVALDLPLHLFELLWEVELFIIHCIHGLEHLPALVLHVPNLLLETADDDILLQVLVLEVDNRLGPRLFDHSPELLVLLAVDAYLFLHVAQLFGQRGRVPVVAPAEPGRATFLLGPLKDAIIHHLGHILQRCVRGKRRV